MIIKLIIIYRVRCIRLF